MSASITEIANLDTIFLRSSSAWSTTALSIPSSDDTKCMANPPDYVLEHQARVKQIWATVQAHDDVFRLQQEAELVAKDTDRLRNECVTAAAELESLAARTRSVRLESMAELAKLGSAAHWKEFWRDETERSRMAAAAGGMVAARWAQRQREAANSFWAAWRSREWNTGTVPTGIAEATSSALGTSADSTRSFEAGGTAILPDGQAAISAAVESVFGELPPIKAIDEIEEEGTSKTATPCVTTTDSDTKGLLQDGDTEEISSDVLDEQEAEGINIETINGNISREEGGVKSPDCSSEGESPENLMSLVSFGRSAEVVTAQEIVVFMGSTMALHLSTFPPSLLDSFGDENRRRCSNFTPQEPSLANIASNSIDEDFDKGREAKWLNVLEEVVGGNEVTQSNYWVVKKY